MSTLDANGVIIYQETDPFSPVSTALNTGFATVSAAIGGINTRLNGTDVVPLVVHAEYQVGLIRRAGTVTVWARGSNSLAAWVMWNLATVPEGYRPVQGAEGTLRPSGNIAVGGFEVRSATGLVYVHNRSESVVSTGWQASVTYVCEASV